MLAIFALVIKIETELEKSREDLSLKEDFSPQLLFEYLDFKSKGKIHFNRFFDFLQEDLGIKDLSLSLAEELFARYDSRAKDSLSYQDFLNILNPRQELEEQSPRPIVHSGPHCEVDSFSKVGLLSGP